MHAGVVDRRRRHGAVRRRRPCRGRHRATPAGSPPRPSRRPAARRRRRSGDVDLLHREAGCDRGDRGDDARRAHHADDAGAVGADAGGDRRSLRPVAHDVLAGVQRRAPGGRARRRGGGRRRPPRWRPCRRTPHRWRAATPARRPARTTTRRVRGRPARPTWSAASASSRRRGRRRATRAGRSCGDPGPGPRRSRAAVSVAPTCQAPSSSRMATRASSGARSSAKPPSPPGATRCDVRPSSAARPASGAAIAGRDGSNDATASTIGCQPVQRHRWAASARCTAAGWRRASGVSAATRMMIPGVQKPHCDAPASANVAVHASASGRPASVVTSRPAARASGVTQATRGWPSIQTVQQPHWPWGLQPSLGVRAPRRSRSASRREAPSSATSTGRPSRRNDVS